MNHIVAFSGGAASAVVASLVKKQYPNDTILLYHSTKTEPDDNDRFRLEVAKFLQTPITEDSDGRDIWQIFDDEQYINGQFVPCSRLLKRERSLAFCRKNMPATVYLGYSLEEGDRAQRTFARYAQHGIEARFPLIEQRIAKDECLHRVESCWGLRLPEMYEWAEHANCIPCVKGGMAYWGIIAINRVSGRKMAGTPLKNTAEYSTRPFPPTAHALFACAHIVTISASRFSVPSGNSTHKNFKKL